MIKVSNNHTVKNEAERVSTVTDTKTIITFTVTRNNVDDNNSNNK